MAAPASLEASFLARHCLWQAGNWRLASQSSVHVEISKAFHILRALVPQSLFTSNITHPLDKLQAANTSLRPLAAAQQCRTGCRQTVLIQHHCGWMHEALVMHPKRLS